MSPAPISGLNAALEGRYRIEREVGEGGMATVYLAADVKHRREVALKVLKPELAAVVGSERFLAEIRTTASLQHPHILPLFDSGQANGFLYYVMPYVDGDTLGARLAREKQLPVDEAIRIATQVAEALDYAHRRGVVHRDIKPANILLQDGKPVISDFGIALAVGVAGGGRLTETGLSLGTPHYMSPEQATGDARVGPAADVYALGCVLYEMLAGEPPHLGSTPQAVLARIITESPRPLTEHRRTVPRNVEAAVGKALERLPADRFGNASAFVAALADSGFGRERGSPRIGGARAPRWQGVALGVSGAAIGILGVTAWGWLDGGDPRPLMRTSLVPPARVEFRPHSSFALSPDGRRLAFVAAGADGVPELWVQPLDAVTGARLEGTENARYPFWSPDGDRLGFFQSGDLKWIPSQGGVPRLVYRPNPEPKGATWGTDGRIVFVPDYRTGLFAVPEEGGDALELTVLDAQGGELSHRHPQFAPDGETLLFLVQTAELGAADDRSRIEALDAEGDRHVVLRVNSSFDLTPDWDLLYWRHGALYVAPVEPRTWSVGGESELVPDGVGINSNEWAFFAASDEGTLVYHAGNAIAFQLDWRDRFGRLVETVDEAGDFRDVELSPSGDRVAYVDGGTAIWTLDFARGTRTRVTFEEVDHYSPTWSPDGVWIAYAANRDPEVGTNLYRAAASGEGGRQIVYEGGAEPIQDLEWSPDGRYIAFTEHDQLVLFDVERGRRRVVEDRPGTATSSSFAPDGGVLAYASTASGRFEVYVTDVAGEGRRTQVSRDGGGAPRWNADGTELYFVSSAGGVRVVHVADRSPLALGLPESLMSIDAGSGFDVAPDGRFLIRATTTPESLSSFRLIMNWGGLYER